MKEIALEILLCIIAASVIMVIHELIKSIVYLCVRKVQKQPASHNNSILAIWRYIDPLGILLSVTSFVPFSKPHLFRIRDKKTNMILGITGFSVIILLFAFATMLYSFVPSGNSFICFKHCCFKDRLPWNGPPV